MATLEKNASGELAAQYWGAGRPHRLGVKVLIDEFHYAGKDHKKKALSDADRLRDMGLIDFQIDSTYDVRPR